MRTRLLLPCLFAVLVAATVIAQTPSPPAPQTPPATGAPPQTPQPTTPPVKRRPVVSTAPTNVTVTLTDATGSPVAGVKVSAVGPVNRQTLSIDTGVARLNSVRPGDYRVRFEHEGFITLERDITVKGGSPLSIDVTLTPAPEPPPAPAPPAPTTSNAPPGEARSVVVVDFVEKNFIRGGDPQKEDELGCTASARTTLLQVRDPSPERALPDADETLYVVAGEGTLRLGNKDVPLAATTLATIPRGTVRGLTKKGKNPLIVLSIVSGPPCTK
jgi:hypothetical protein